MPLTRREAFARLAGLIAMSAVPPRTLAASASSDPLAGTIVHYLEGLEAGGEETRASALQFCCPDGPDSR